MLLALFFSCGPASPTTGPTSTPPPMTTRSILTPATPPSTPPTSPVDTAPRHTSTTDTAPPGAWRHTITVDGDLSEWSTVDEGFPTQGGTNFVTWDETMLYIEHPDTTRHENNNWLFIHVGNGGEGSRRGHTWELQKLAPPFDATTLVATEAGGGSDWLRTFAPPPATRVDDWLGTEGSAVAQDDAHEALELAIPLAAVGATEHVDLLLHLMDENHPREGSDLWCYATTPAAAFTDDYCRTAEFTAWLSIDLGSSLPPTAQDVEP